MSRRHHQRQRTVQQAAAKNEAEDDHKVESIGPRREPPSEATLRDDERRAQLTDAIVSASKVLDHFHDFGWPDFEGVRAKLNAARALIR